MKIPQVVIRKYANAKNYRARHGITSLLKQIARINNLYKHKKSIKTRSPISSPSKATNMMKRELTSKVV